MDFSGVLINCTRLGSVMSEPQGAMTDKMFDRLEYLKSRPDRTDKQELERIELQFRMDNYDPTALSKGCMAYLLFLYQYMKYGKQQFLMNPGSPSQQMIKGTRQEKKSFEIIKRVTGHQLYRNKALLKNEYLKGQLDVIDSTTVETASRVVDIKTSFKQFDFMKSVASDRISRMDSFQMQGYLALTGKDYGDVYHVLTDFTEDVIEEEKDKMMKLLCPDGIVTEYFEEEWAEAENSMRFGHIPDEERVVFNRVERDDKIIAKIYEKVQFCREWLTEFEQKHKNRISRHIEEWQRQLY